MFEGGAHPANRAPAHARRSARRRAVDGLIVGGREVWVVVATSRDDVEALLRDSDDEAPLRLCRAVLEGGVLVLGAADPERDPLVSDLMRDDGEDRG